MEKKAWLFFLLQTILYSIAFSQTNITTDTTSLLSFKSAVTSNTSNNVLSTNWSTTTSCCNWIGVACDARFLRVISLNLSDMGFGGVISPYLGNLSSLVSVDLSFNDFQGEIPPEVGNLANLRTLKVNDNGLAGLIPSAIFNISSIETVDISNNKLTGSLPEYMSDHLIFLSVSNNQLKGSFPNALCNQRNLVALSLARNQFQGKIPREIGNITSLKELFLNHNNFIGEIPEEIGYLRNLKKFYAVENMLNGSIPPSLFSNSSLMEFNIRNNSISGNLPSDMCHGLSSLTILGIRNNNIMGSIPLGIENCTSLVTLDFSNNMLTGTIPNGLGNLPNIVNIVFEFNSLNGTIPLDMYNSSTLRILTLASNHLSGQLPPTFGLGLPNLSELYLWGNQLSGTIPASLSNASMLSTIDLNTNSFTGFMPDTLGDLKLLQRLNFQYNSLRSSTTDMAFLTSLTKCRNLNTMGFSGNLISGVLPSSVGNFSTSFQQFFAGDCNIEGTIPSEIGNITNLIILQLGKNNLTGSIPSTIGKLQYLQGLEFSENLLQGSVPDELCLLSRLGYLYLSQNELSGPILKCIGDLSALRVLYMASNKFSSVIPSTLTSLTSIFDVNFSTNALTGNIPLSIGNMKMLRQLDLSKNEFYGDIPITLGSLQSLVNLSLAHNNMQGAIPSSFEGLISLESLDVAHNNLSGEIPKSLEKLEYLKNMNVSYNNLQGEIPNGGPFAKFSAQSFMMNPALCGAPRFGVTPCKNVTKKKSMKKILIYVLPSIFIVLLAILLYVVIKCRKKKVPVALDDDEASLLNPKWRRISQRDILQATDGLNKTNLLGIGSYGSVYKGVLSDGSVVAVKVFNLEIEGAFKSFDAECEILCNIRHRNLLKIISTCSKHDFKALVLEYMPNGSLEEMLACHNESYCLDFLQRVNVMIDVAFGLEYLHHCCEFPILHCDLKPSNILLDEDFVAHVGDFGISKLLGDGESLAQTKTLATIGYMAPEYGSGGIVSTKNDIYAYGIVLMETFTKKKHSDEMFTNGMTIKRWIGESLSGDITNITTASLITKDDGNFATKQDCIVTILKLALRCCAELPEDRVGIKDVLNILTDARTKFQITTAENKK